MPNDSPRHTSQERRNGDNKKPVEWWRDCCENNLLGKPCDCPYVTVKRCDVQRWMTAMPVLATLLDFAVPRSKASDIARDFFAEMKGARHGS